VGVFPSHFSLSLLVRSFVLLENFLTCVLRCLESIVPHAAFSVSFGMPLACFLCMGTDPSLDCLHRLTLIEVSLYSTGTHQDYVTCVLLRNLSEYISL